MTATVTGLVARLLEERIREEFRSVLERDPEAKPMLRLTDFQPKEVAIVCERLRATSPRPDGHVVDIVAAVRDDAPGFDGFRLGAGESLTAFRNRSRRGSVLFQLTEISDSQGLSAFHGIADSSLVVDLERGDDTTEFAAIDAAWTEAGGSGGPPGALADAIGQVRAGLGHRDRPALRAWCAFVLAVATKALADDRPIELAGAGRLAGLSLVELGMFPDPYLFRRAEGISRSLAQNDAVSTRRHPNGSDVEPDDVAQRIRTADLATIDGVVLNGALQTALRGRLQRYISDHDAGRNDIEFGAWVAIWRDTTSPALLGDLIREALVDSMVGLAAAKLFDELDVREGLNSGEDGSAQEVVEAELDDGTPLVGLLPTGLRRRVEKQATPRHETQDDPLRALVRYVHGLDPGSSASHLTLEPDPRQLDGECTRWLFAFLYGRTLSEISDASRGSAAELQVADSLLTPASCPFVPSTIDAEPDDDDASSLEDSWRPLRLVLRRASEPRSALHRFVWHPDSIDELAAFARLVLAPNAGFPIDTGDFETWCAGLARGAEIVDRPPRSDPADSLPERWRGLRHELLAPLGDGIEIAALRTLFDRWLAIVEEARATLIPQGAPLPALDSLLDVDTLHAGQGRSRRTWMLATHPLRLRWFAEHLSRTKRDLLLALDGSLLINSENESFYFARLQLVSPHRHPPVIVPGDRTIATSVREHGLHEEYASVRRGDVPSDEWTGGIDDASIAQLTACVRQYLDAFPYKADGLSLLLIDRVGDPDAAVRLARRLVALRMNTGGSIAFELRVLAPTNRHAAIIRELATVETAAARSNSLLPPVRVALEALEDATAVLQRLAGTVDLAFVPDLFSADTKMVARTRRPTSGPGPEFDVWLDAASHTEQSTEQNENVARLLLPRASDSALEAWSTLTVRRDQNGPLTLDEVDGAVEFFMVQVRFDQNRSIFDLLHVAAQWVVTLDPFIGREQIDAMTEVDRPDVILVRAGVGKNEAYTLVVSSRAGRSFVTARLRARLEHALDVTPEAAGLAAERIYDVGRNAVPGLLLRATGLGRGTEEIIGIVATRYVIDERFPVDEHPARVVWWVALDNHVEWFGGPRRPRADLLRVTFGLSDERVVLGVDIIESKFRQSFDLGSARDQLAATRRLLEQALMPADDGGEGRADLRFWHRELLRAYDEASRVPRPAADLPEVSIVGIDAGLADARIRQALGDGVYDVHVRAIAVGVQSADVPLPAPPHFPEADVIAVGRAELLRIIGAISARRAPDASDRSAIADGEVRVEARDDHLDVDPSPPDAPSIRTEAAAIGAARSVIGAASIRQRAQIVIDTLADFGVAVRADDGVGREGPGFYVLRFTLERGVAFDRVAARAQELKLALGLPQDLSLRIYVDSGTVVVEAPKVDHERYPVDAEALWRKIENWPSDRLWAPVGEDIEGQVVGIDFSDSGSPHLLIAGTTGSGKSVALETILLGLARHYPPDTLRLSLVDPKGTELVAFEGSDHLDHDIGIYPEDAIETLESAVAEMTRRYERFRAARARSLPEYNAGLDKTNRLPWRLIVLDEYADLTSDPSDKKTVEALLQRLAQKARAAGIHVIVATQRPTADVIGTTIRSNLPAQLALRVRSSTESRVILAEVGAESLAGKGDAFLRTALGMTRLQCARVLG